MENSKLIKLIPILILGFFVVQISTTFAYGVETHAFLTDEVIKFHNQSFPNSKIPDELKAYLIDGSRKEDVVPRWMNHFYDPVYNRGLTDTVLGTWQKSKDWAQDSNNQNSFTYKIPATIASILTAIQEQKVSTLTTETDFTWQRTIRFYIQGEKEKAMFLLGHILHLIEDKSVPDHTRNDPHPGDSPYENYTAQSTLNNPDKNLSQRLKNKSPVILNNLNSYFDELGKYSNNNFYSRDRVGLQSGYKLPEPDYFQIGSDGKQYGMRVDTEFGDYFLIKTPSKLLTMSLDNEEFFKGNLVIPSYWFRLSTKSVQYGAGIINLFFQEAEKAKNDPNFAKTEEKSIFAKAFEATKNLFAQVGNFFSGILGAGQDFQEVGQVTLEQSSDAQPSQAENQFPKNEVQTPFKTDVELPKVNQQNQPQENQLAETEEDKEVPQQEEIPQATTTLLQTTSTLPQTANFKQCSFQTNQFPSRQKIIINEVAWMGMPPKTGETATQAANNEWVELKNISTNEIDVSGWQLIDKGEQIKINLASINGSKVIGPGQFILLERTDDNSVPGITADLIYSGTLSNTNEGLRLFDGQCNLIDEVLANPDWPAGDNSAKKTMERKSDFSWYTSSIVGGTPKRENSAPAAVYSGGGGGGAPSNIQNQVQYSKILINEIQLASNSSVHDEFVELYNPNSGAVDLTGWYLQKETKSGISSISTFAPKDLFLGKTIGSNQYLLIANTSSTFSSSADVLTKSTYGLADNNTLILKNPNGEIVDKVGWGEADDCENNCVLGPSDNQSVQRKFQNNTFIDTDNNAQDFEIQTCPSPKAQSLSCQLNRAPSAFFVYSLSNPQVGDLITFNAASSSDPDGNIISYQWNFGDNATSSITTATTTHSYSQGGNYSASLIVFDNQNASSSATSTIISVQSAGVNHIVISEIMASAGYGHSNEEFIELYNLTDQNINLTGHFLKRINSFSSTSTENLLADFSTSTIAAKSFFLITSTEYSNASTTPDLRYNRSYHLADDEDIVILENNLGEEVNRVVYSSIDAGKSLERKAFSGGNCVSAQGDGEFLGNDCDTDSATDFEIRNTPNPQNSSSLPEPRSAPTTPQNFSIQYSSSTVELVFDWQTSQDYSGATSSLTYRITDISNTSSTIPTIETASTTAGISIYEVGRDYQFSIRAFDQDGLDSISATSTISVTSFISSAFFFQNPQATSSTEYLIDLYYDYYPFIPPKYQSNISGLVFYLNQENPPAPESLNLGGLSGCLWDYALMPEAMKIYYPNYSFNQSSSGNIVVLPNILNPPELYNQLYGGLPGGVYQYIINRNQLEDNHLRVSVRENFASAPTSQDYFKIAFYSYTTTRASCEQILVAVDKTQYHFQENFPFNNQFPSPLTTPTNFQVVFQQESENPYFLANWATSTDPDSLDKEINYQLDYWVENNPNSKQQWLGKQISTQITPPSSGNYIFELKVSDEFNLFSESVFASSTAFVPVVLADTTNYSNWNPLGFGGKYSSGADYETQKIAQKFHLSQTANITSITIGLANCWECNNPSGAKISLRQVNGEIPSDNEIITFHLTRNEIPRYNTFTYSNGVKTFSFFVASPTELAAGDYFLVIEPEDGPSDDSWNLVMLYSGGEYYEAGLLYKQTNPNQGEWTLYDTRDTYFRVKGFFVK